MSLVATGQKNSEIGVALNISERTVKSHLSNVFAKTKARNRVELALRYARRAEGEGSEWWNT